jgi:hypothetical protein
MAVTDPLATVDDYRSVYPGAGADNDTELLSQLTAVSRYIEHVCGQMFTKDTAAVARVFIGDGTSQLWVGENIAVTPTLVKMDTDNDGTYETTVSTMELWPLNAAYGAEVNPWRRIDLPSWGTYTYWPKGSRVQVTAQWGWPAIPAAARQACIQLTAILRIESPRATSSIDEVGRVIGMSNQARGIVEELISQYPKLAT